MLERSCSSGQCEIERRAFARFALGPHAAAMTEHHALHDGESHASARELSRAMQALELPEQLAVISHVEAGAVVLHVVDVPRILADAAQLDRGDFPRSGELDRVGKQIEPDLADERAIAPAGWQRLQHAV